MFVAGLLGVVYLSLRSPEVQVPDVINKTYNDGTAALSKAGLDISERAQRYKPDVQPGMILDQTPHAGEVVKSGQTVRVVVSRSPREGEQPPVAEVPDEKKDDAAKKSKNDNDSDSGTASKNENRDRRNKNTNKNANANGNLNANSRNLNNSNNTNNVNANRDANRNQNANINGTLNLNRNRNTGNRNSNANANVNRNTNTVRANSNVNRHP